MPRLALQTSHSTVDIKQYRAKCSELEEVTKKLRAKCQEYEHLSTRYNNLKARLQDKQQPQQQTTSSSVMPHRSVALSLTSRDPFVMLNAPEPTTVGIPPGRGTKRTSPGAPVWPDDAWDQMTSPSKRVCSGTLNSNLPAPPEPPSSPLTTHKPLLLSNQPKRGNGSTIAARPALKAPPSSPPLAPVSSKVTGAAPKAQAAAAASRAPPTMIPILSSQETRLDYSDPPFIPEEDGELLCLATQPEEYENKCNKYDDEAIGDENDDNRYGWPF
ncbi:hypothetical protein IWW38_002499, partial [Coemansia aciculifera]